MTKLEAIAEIVRQYQTSGHRTLEEFQLIQDACKKLGLNLNEKCAIEFTTGYRRAVAYARSFTISTAIDGLFAEYR